MTKGAIRDVGMAEAYDRRLGSLMPPSAAVVLAGGHHHPVVLADGLTNATLLLGVGTLLVAYATWRLGSRAADETRAQWRPVILVRAREHEMDVKLRLAAGHLLVDVENAGRGPALDLFTDGFDG